MPAPHPVVAPAHSARRSPALLAMYVSFAMLEALDVHSTMSAFSKGGVEANPAMRGIAGNPGALIAITAAAGIA